MVIRSEQFEAFGAAAAAARRESLMRHARSFSPLLASPLDDITLAGVVDKCTSRAEGYGIHDHGFVRLYLELMLSLGADFDTDPQLPWAGKTLRSPSARNQVERVDELYANLTSYLSEVNGPGRVHSREALRRLSMILSQPENLRRAAGRGIAPMLSIIYPQKYLYAGEPTMQGVVQSAEGAAIQRSLPRPEGTAIIALLMFGLGHGVLTDEMYAWAGSALSAVPGKTDERVERLRNQAAAFFDRILEQST
jgi:hypothetical protein